MDVIERGSTLCSAATWPKAAPGTAPEVDDLLAAVIYATGAAQFMSPREVLGERIAHGFKARAHMPFRRGCRDEKSDRFSLQNGLHAARSASAARPIERRPGSNPDRVELKTALQTGP
jgi:hypothetical protein